MLAMQYEIGLPADYDMEVIRRRVRTSGHLMDTYPGLGVKAFLVRERGVDGSPVNVYAPFYLWADAGGRRPVHRPARRRARASRAAADRRDPHAGPCPMTHPTGGARRPRRPARGAR